MIICYRCKGKIENEAGETIEVGRQVHDVHNHYIRCVEEVSRRLTALEAAFVNDRPGPNMRKIMERVSALESRQKPEAVALPDVDGLSGDALWFLVLEEVGITSGNRYWPCGSTLDARHNWWNLGELEMVMKEKWVCRRISYKQTATTLHYGWNECEGTGIETTDKENAEYATPDDYARLAVKLVRRIKAAKEASDGGR